MKDIKKENINSNFTSDEAVFSSQYRRRLYIKHFLLTKRGAGLLLFMAFLNYMDMLHVYSIIFFLMVIVSLYIKNKDLSHERDKTVWLIKARKKFIDMLEAEKIESDNRKAEGNFLKEFFSLKKEDVKDSKSAD